MLCSEKRRKGQKQIHTIKKKLTIPHIGLLGVDQILEVQSIDHTWQPSQGLPRQYLYPESLSGSHFQWKQSSSQEKNSHSQPLAQLLNYAMNHPKNYAKRRRKSEKHNNHSKNKDEKELDAIRAELRYNYYTYGSQEHKTLITQSSLFSNPNFKNRRIVEYESILFYFLVSSGV